MAPTSELNIENFKIVDIKVSLMRDDNGEKSQLIILIHHDYSVKIPNRHLIEYFISRVDVQPRQNVPYR